MFDNIVEIFGIQYLSPLIFLFNFQKSVTRRFYKGVSHLVNHLIVSGYDRVGNIRVIDLEMIH